MFSQISWSSYIIFIVIVSTFYYLVIGLRFYREDILRLFSGNRNAHEIKGEQKLSKINLGESFEKLNISQQAQSLGDEIQAFVKQVRKESISREVLLASLKLLAAKYPAVKDSSFRPVIQNTILKECETNCSIHLDDKELCELWGVGGASL